MKTSAYDVALHLRTPQEMAAYLDASLEEAPVDISGTTRTLGDIARAKGMRMVAKALGLRLHAQPVQRPNSATPNIRHAVHKPLAWRRAFDAHPSHAHQNRLLQLRPADR